MTDLEKHVNQPGRAKLVKQFRAKINELGIEYIFFQFISVTGRVVGKGIPTDHWERTCERNGKLINWKKRKLIPKVASNDRKKSISTTLLINN